MTDTDNTPMHVDEFVGTQVGEHCYARWMLMHFRLPAALQMDFAPFIEGKKLFCTYFGKRYRCIGASRLGDVWLTADFERESGYDLRVSVQNCNKWSDAP